jgi:phospholipase C
MGFRIPAVLVSPYARRRHVNHEIYGFESILKMIRYKFGLPPLTPRDLYANNIATAFDWEKPDFTPPDLPQPPEIIVTGCPGTPPVSSSGAGIDGGALGGGSPGPLLGGASSPYETPERKPHDLYKMVSSGYLERLGFNYRPATPATMYRSPSSLGFST